MTRERCQSILPEDAKPVVIKGQNRGISTNDGSFDYTSEGAKFLRSDNRIERAGIRMYGIYPDGD